MLLGVTRQKALSIQDQHHLLYTASRLLLAPPSLPSLAGCYVALGRESLREAKWGISPERHMQLTGYDFGTQWPCLPSRTVYSQICVLYHTQVCRKLGNAVCYKITSYTYIRNRQCPPPLYLLSYSQMTTFVLQSDYSEGKKNMDSHSKPISSNLST